MNDVNPNALRVISTARTEQSINAAAKKGYRPLVKAVIPSEKIHSKIQVLQNTKTGEITLSGDYRRVGGDPGDFTVVIDWMDYYPHTFPSPFAAYLLPPDLKIGERVYLEDLIEDLVEMVWNQGDAYRLEGCEAVWNGTDFEIDHDPDNATITMIG